MIAACSACVINSRDGRDGRQEVGGGRRSNGRESAGRQEWPSAGRQECGG